MTARTIRRLERRRADAAAPERRPVSEHAVVALQRAAGNAAVARVLARAPAGLALPPGATHLAEYRRWAAGLRDLVKLPKPPVSVPDIADANLWLAKVVATLEIARGIGDR